MSNTFGTHFRMTTWGESHGPAVGVVIDGCPAGLSLDVQDISEALLRRATGASPYTSTRKAHDRPEILSGVFEGKTTGTPICILTHNKGYDSAKYAHLKDVFRPGHANYTYLMKYGVFDHRGGGRASARETVARVMAGVVAQKICSCFGIQVGAYTEEIGGIVGGWERGSVATLRKAVADSLLGCPDPAAEKQMVAALEKAQALGDTLGGIITVIAEGVPAGLGDPIYAKVEAELASAMLSINAAKGFEMGEGFASARGTGSRYNDRFMKEGDRVVTATNHSGGVLGGITNGMPLWARVAFKPVSSIRQPQTTLNLKGEEVVFAPDPQAELDPCPVIRAIPVVEAMMAIVLADRLLVQHGGQLHLQNNYADGAAYAAT